MIKNIAFCIIIFHYCIYEEEENMVKIRTVVVTAFTILTFSLVLPVFAVSHLDGEWNYGGHHDPRKWGACSNYYHRDRYHFSYVGSLERNNERRPSVQAGHTSYAFINTNFGERVTFDAGW